MKIVIDFLRLDEQIREFENLKKKRKRDNCNKKACILLDSYSV